MRHGQLIVPISDCGRDRLPRLQTESRSRLGPTQSWSAANASSAGPGQKRQEVFNRHGCKSVIRLRAGQLPKFVIDCRVSRPQSATSGNYLHRYLSPLKCRNSPLEKPFLAVALRYFLRSRPRERKLPVGKGR